MKYIEEARQVLNDEARALQFLAESLGEEFEKTVDCLLNISGRIAVTGMGKSGHVARKIAATLASTHYDVAVKTVGGFRQQDPDGMGPVLTQCFG